MGTDSSMELSGRRIKGLTGTMYEDISTWPTPDEGALVGRALTRYLQRKEGVRMYFRGEPDASIKKKCGISSKQIYRLIRERCLEIHPDGMIFGWRGLIPNKHIQPYKRTNVVKVSVYGYGASGAMTSLLELNPDLKKKFDRQILKFPKSDELGSAKKARQSLWKWFLKEVKKLGYELRGEWPFNTKSNGYISVYRYVDKVMKSNPKKAATILGGPDLARKMISGDGVDRPVEHIFQRVEMDAHKIDSRMCVLFPHPSGGYIEKIIYRLWVIVIIEVVSRAILGYYLSMRREVSKEDVLRAIKRSLTKWQPMTLSFCNGNIAYVEGAGFPSSLSFDFLGACWDETSVDGALAETCKTVRDLLKDVVGSDLLDPSKGFSSRRGLDDRPFVEVFFRQLASYGFQKMSNTTGGKASDRKGRDPEKVALKSRFQVEYAEELLDVLIANYNATPHTSLGNRTPLEYLKFMHGRPGMHLRHADPDSVNLILSYRKKCKVLGGVESGRRPYVNFECARYSNEILSQRYDLVGQYIWVINHLDEDARVALASTLDGSSLGVLRASPPWHKLPHSLKVRQAINSCIRRGVITVSSGSDAVEVFLDYVEIQKDKKLPIHPAYLEARQILINQARNNVTQSMLEEALGKNKDEGRSNENADATNQALKTSEGVDRKPLPSRRLAASK